MHRETIKIRDKFRNFPGRRKAYGVMRILKGSLLMVVVEREDELRKACLINYYVLL